MTEQPILSRKPALQPASPRSLCCCSPSCRAVIVLLYGVTEWSVLVVLFGPLVVTIVLLMRLITEVKFPPGFASG